MALAQFRIYTPQDFQKYLMNTDFSREIRVMQNHHTWEPNYKSLSPSHREMYWLESMRNYHIHDNGWSDIGQNKLVVHLVIPSPDKLLVSKDKVTPFLNWLENQ